NCVDNRQTDAASSKPARHLAENTGGAQLNTVEPLSSVRLWRPRPWERRLPAGSGAGKMPALPAASCRLRAIAQAESSPPAAPGTPGGPAGPAIAEVSCGLRGIGQAAPSPPAAPVPPGGPAGPAISADSSEAPTIDDLI